MAIGVKHIIVCDRSGAIYPGRDGLNLLKEWLAEHPSKVCPTCAERAVRPVMLGMPGGSVWEAMDAGIIDIHIGGCMLPGPSYQCSACGQELSTAPGRKLVPFTGDWGSA